MRAQIKQKEDIHRAQAAPAAAAEGGAGAAAVGGAGGSDWGDAAAAAGAEVGNGASKNAGGGAGVADWGDARAAACAAAGGGTGSGRVQKALPAMFARGFAARQDALEGPQFANPYGFMVDEGIVDLIESDIESVD